MHQTHILYSGHVQGVGFRYTVRQYATRLNLTGWVKNLADGSVEVLAEGSQEDINRLCDQVDNYFRQNIRNREISTRPIQQPQFFDFQIAI